jgi:hypothetical protein
MITLLPMINGGKSSRTSLIVTLIVVIGAVIYEITLARISRFSFEFTSSADVNLWVFVVLAVIYGLGQYIILRWTQQRIISNTMKRSRLTTVLKGVGITQWVLILILVLTIVQILVTSSYSIVLILGAIWISYGLAALMMFYLAWKLYAWFTDNRNLFVLAYLIAVAVLVSNIVITTTYTTQILLAQPESVMKNIGHRNPIPPEPVATAYFYSDIITFASMWIASGILFRNFTTLGKSRYWLLMSIPLIYYLAQFQPFLISQFSSYILSDPIGFTTLYTVVFTAIEPIGGFLFGLAFWATARKLESRAIKDYLFIAGAGLLLFFASNHAALLVNYPFPPFGLVTISYLGLSSYLILTGIHSSAISVAQDNKLRSAIRESIEQQRANLIENIGTSEMRYKIYKRVFELSKKLSDSMEEETYVSSSLTTEQVKDYINEVMEERGIRDK